MRRYRTLFAVALVTLAAASSWPAHAAMLPWTGYSPEVALYVTDGCPNEVRTPNGYTVDIVPVQQYQGKTVRITATSAQVPINGGGVRVGAMEDCEFTSTFFLEYKIVTPAAPLTIAITNQIALLIQSQAVGQEYTVQCVC
jgi:hypothetical protein